MKKKHLLLLPLGAYSLYFGCDQTLYHLNDRFRISNIDHESVIFSDEKPLHLLPLLDQPYTYLGQGSQCYIFESQDKKYVVKFFKHQRFRSPKKKKKWDELHASCLIANEKLHDESGLLYVHLAKTQFFKKRIYISDRLHRHYKVDLDSHDWVLQKKGELLQPTLDRLMEKNDVAGAKLALKNLVDVLKKRIDLGIDDRDAVLTKNVAFIGLKAIFIDIGSFGEGGSGDPGELRKITRRTKEWLDQKYPELGEYLEILLL